MKHGSPSVANITPPPPFRAHSTHIDRGATAGPRRPPAKLGLAPSPGQHGAERPQPGTGRSAQAPAPPQKHLCRWGSAAVGAAAPDRNAGHLGRAISRRPKGKSLAIESHPPPRRWSSRERAVTPPPRPTRSHMLRRARVNDMAERGGRVGRPAVNKQVERVQIATPCPSPSRRASCRGDGTAYASPPRAGGHIIRQEWRSLAPLTGPTATLGNRQHDSTAADGPRGVKHAREANKVCRPGRYGRLSGKAVRESPPRATASRAEEGVSEGSQQPRVRAEPAAPGPPIGCANMTQRVATALGRRRAGSVRSGRGHRPGRYDDRWPAPYGPRWRRVTGGNGRPAAA